MVVSLVRRFIDPIHKPHIHINAERTRRFCAEGERPARERFDGDLPMQMETYGPEE